MSGMRGFVFLLGFSAAMTHVAAETPRSAAFIQEIPGFVLGRVVDAENGRALAGIAVSLDGGPPAAGAPGRPAEPRVMLTDSDGRFVFRRVPTGTYNVRASTGGSGFSPSGFLVTGLGHLVSPYLPGGFGQQRPDGPLDVVDVPREGGVGDVTIRLWRGGAIEGTVLDEAGEPLIDVTIAAVRRTSDGRLLTGPTTKSDDRGSYRLGTLFPGHYVVVVPQMQVLMPAALQAAFNAGTDPALGQRLTSAGAPAPSATGFRVGSTMAASATTAPATNLLWPRAEGARTYVYQSTFFPSASSPRDARVVSVGSGATVTGLVVRLQPVSAVNVSGVLTDARGPVLEFGVHLVPAESGDAASALEVAATATDGRGAFTFPLVPPGSYRVVAVRRGAAAGRGAPPSTPTEDAGAWASASVSVGDQPIADLALALRPGLRVRGRLEFEGARARPDPARVRQVPMLAVPAAPLTRDGNTSPTRNAQVEATGDMSFPALPAGRYLFTPMALAVEYELAGWTLRALTIDGRDAIDRPVLIEGDVTDLVVTYTDRPSAVSGTVRDARGAIDPTASVFLFPADPDRWRDVTIPQLSPTARLSPWRFKTVRVSKSGTFAIPRVVPGDYLVAAMPDAGAGDWPDPVFLKAIAATATRVRVDEAANVQLQLVTGGGR